MSCIEDDLIEEDNVTPGEPLDQRAAVSDGPQKTLLRSWCFAGGRILLRKAGHYGGLGELYSKFFNSSSVSPREKAQPRPKLPLG